MSLSSVLAVFNRKYILILASLLPLMLKEAQSTGRIQAAFQFVTASGLFEVDSKVQKHELEKGLTMQCQISCYFPLHSLWKGWT